MSELNDVVNEVVSDAEVMTVPIDDTLTVSGEAADAKAVGDALALKADKSELSASITVNGQSADAQGAILVNANQIEMSGSDTTNVKAAIEAVAAKTGADIPLNSTAGAPKISEAISSASNQNATTIPMANGSEVMISQKIAAMDVVANANSSAISALQSKAGDTILLESDGTETIAEAMAERVKTVNGEGPDETGNVQVQHALTADNLTSAASQNSIGEWTRRTSGGSASIQDGMAWLSSVRGNRSHIGYVPEVLNMTLTTAPREEGQDPITATIDRDTFVAYVAGSTTVVLVYTTSWSASPTLYGITVTGTPVSGDQITVVYTAEDRGTIIQSDPQSMVSVGANLFNPDTGYAIGLKYSSQYGFAIKGTYTAVKYSATVDGTKTTLSPADGLFDIPANGYIWVEGSSTDTMVFMTWSDWILAADWPDYEDYSADEIDLSDVMETYFPYGLLRVGDIRDEIDFNTGLAISNIERLTYSAENLATAQASGRTYEYDTNYIYLERASAVTHDIELDGEYAVSDHGLEYFTDTDVSVYAVVIYGNNLKNKLERDVLTKSQDLVDNLSTEDATKALSAKQGKVLSDHIALIGTTYSNNSGSKSLANDTLTEVMSQSVPAGTYVIIRGADFASNATGVRKIASSTGVARTDINIVPANTTGETFVQHISIETYSVQTDIKVYCLQSSGGALTVYPYIYAVRVK